jgi:hypothetical protein
VDELRDERHPDHQIKSPRMAGDHRDVARDRCPHQRGRGNLRADRPQSPVSTGASKSEVFTFDCLQGFSGAVVMLVTA